MCKSWCELLIALVIIIVAIMDKTWSKMVIIIAAIVLIIHSFTCKKCFGGMKMQQEMKTSSKKKK